jgi:GNAT superfamily N-acetyltransferase
MRVGPASPEDVERFLLLAGEVEDWFGPMVEDPGFGRAVVRAIDRGSALVAIDGEVTLGGLLFSHHRPPHYDIRWLVVTADRRGAGVGEELVAHAVRAWVQPPAVVSVVTFGPDHPGARSRRFYTRLGFDPVEAVEPGPEGGSRQRFELRLDALPSWALRR